MLKPTGAFYEKKVSAISFSNKLNHLSKILFSNENVAGIRFYKFVSKNSVVCTCV